VALHDLQPFAVEFDRTLGVRSRLFGLQVTVEHKFSIRPGADADTRASVSNSIRGACFVPEGRGGFRPMPRLSEEFSLLCEFSLPSTRFRRTFGWNRPASQTEYLEFANEKVVGASGFEPPTPRSRTNAQFLESFEKSPTLREA
jgi:hypothetical protein